MMIEWVFTFLIIGYCFFIVFLWLGWERIPVVSNEDFRPSVTVIIPVRNEAADIENLLNDLHNQSYNGHLDILVVDDHSEDDSANIINGNIKNALNFELISLVDAQGKKAAIAAGVKYTSAEIILTTDGDCRAQSTWVEMMVNAFANQTQFVSGPVKFTNEESIFSKLQAIEFASLIGSGAALIGWNKPVMANGANMAFRKKAFTEVNGFDGNKDTASGDDVFLLHKIVKKYPDSVVFVMQKSAIIQTNAQRSLHSFINQRIRWASKWKAYSQGFTQTIAVLVFMVSLSLLIFPFLVMFQKVSLYFWLNLLIIKSFFDFLFIRQVTRFLKDKINLPAFLLLQLFYPVYIVLTTLFSFQKSYYWKGRQVK